MQFVAAVFVGCTVAVPPVVGQTRGSRAALAPLLPHAADISPRVLSASQSKVRAITKQPAEPMVVAATDATNAALSAQDAEQSAAIAMHVAAHSQQIAHDAAAALRYTEWALDQAHLEGGDAAELGREADGLDGGAGDDEEALRRELEGIEQQVGGMEVNAAKGGHAGDAEAEADLEALRQRLKELEGQLGDGKGNYGAGYDSGYEAGRTQAGGPGFDINSEPVPFPTAGEPPFGRQETGNQLTASSIKESEGMVDQIEQTQSMESKRAVYRALTRLRGLTIASYDSIAKAHMANVDEHARTHRWRETHQIRHLAEEEADIDMWAFPMSTHVSPVVPAAPSPAPAGVAAPGPAASL